jgi:hypothetical protein
VARNKQSRAALRRIVRCSLGTLREAAAQRLVIHTVTSSWSRLPFVDEAARQTEAAIALDATGHGRRSGHRDDMVMVLLMGQNGGQG